MKSKQKPKLIPLMQSPEQQISAALHHSAHRRSFIKFGTLTAAIGFCQNAFAAAKRVARGGPASVKFTGVGLDPSSIDQISAPGATVNAHADNATIGNISGNADIKSKLSKIRIGLSFSPYASLGVNTDCGRASDATVTKRLTQLGLSKEQIHAIQRAINSQLGAESSKAVKPRVAIKSHIYPGDEKNGAAVALNENRGSIEIPIPWDIPLPELKPSFNVNNLVIRDLQLSSTTDIATDPIQMSKVGVDDFQVALADSDAFSADRAELDDFRLSPITIPSVELRNLNFPISIPKLGASTIPINIQSTDAGADVQFNLFSWRLEAGIDRCFDLWITSIHVWCKFGFLFTVYLKFRWVVTLLKVAILIKDAFVNAIKILISVPQIIAKNIKIGLLHVGRILYSH